MCLLGWLKPFVEIVGELRVCQFSSESVLGGTCGHNYCMKVWLAGERLE